MLEEGKVGFLDMKHHVFSIFCIVLSKISNHEHGPTDKRISPWTNVLRHFRP